MSQDVKNLSAYVYDISCSVSYLVNEKIQKENIPVVANGGGQEGSDEGEYSEQYEQEDERSLRNIADPEQGESSFIDIASTNVDTNESADVLTSESNPHFWNEVNAETLSDSKDEVYVMYKSTNYPPEELTPSNLSETLELPSSDECQEIQRMVKSSNSAGSSDYTTHMGRTQGQQLGTQQMMSARNASVVHARVDLEERRHKCSICEKAFKSHSNLVRHTQLHSGERPYLCNVCGKAFTQSSDLTLHIRVHTGEKPYKCTQCRKGFTQSSHLTLHMRSHTGEKPYRCDVCKKEFPEKGKLQIHMRVHSGERPYSCSVCKMAFSVKANLKVHMRMHTGERPYSCSVCKKAFSVQANLKVHLRIHTGERPYKCTLCGKAFQQRHVLTKHMHTHPADNPV